MNFRDYQEKAMETRTKIISPVVYPALALNEEAGEVAGKVKKQWRDKGGDFYELEFKLDVMKEMGDVLWYLAELADELGVNLEAVAAMNLEKLEDRKVRGTLHGSGDNR